MEGVNIQANCPWEMSGEHSVGALWRQGKCAAGNVPEWHKGNLVTLGSKHAPKS